MLASPLLQLAVALVTWGIEWAECSAQDAASPIEAGAPVQVVIGADAPGLAGHGRFVAFRHVSDFAGHLYVWARSEELDPFLRLAKPSGEPLAEDDDSGGGTTAALRLSVVPGQELRVLVAATASDGPGAVTLCLVAAPETDATRAAVQAAQASIEEVKQARQRGEPERARLRLREAIFALLDSDQERRSTLVVDAAWILGSSAQKLGDFEAASDAFTFAVEQRARCLPPDHRALMKARGNLANARYSLGDLQGARDLERSVLEVLERTLSADHPDLLLARTNLALTIERMGDLRGAFALLESVLEERERSLPANHRNVLVARLNLANVTRELGDLHGALALERSVVEALEKNVPAGDPDLLAARANLAVTLSRLGELAEARGLLESVLAAREHSLPADHPTLVRTRMILATVLKDLGDLAGARAIQELVLESRERALPADHPELLIARNNLASTLVALGDLLRARALQESVLEARERSLAVDHPQRLRARLNLACTLRLQGDLQGARAMLERVLATRDNTLPPDHPDRLGTQLTLASTLGDLGEWSAARELQERTLAAYERSLSVSHPSTLLSRANLASTLALLGDLPGARNHLEAALAGYESILPADHPELLRARSGLVLALEQMGDLPGARTQVQRLVAGMRRRLEGALSLSAREACEVVGDELSRLAIVLYVCSQDGAFDAADADAFELTETLRLVSGAGSGIASRSEDDAELAGLAREAARARARLNDLVTEAAGQEVPHEDQPGAVAALASERDRLERALREMQLTRGALPPAIDFRRLAAALPDGTAFAGYLRYQRRTLDEEERRWKPDVDSMLAHVLRPDGSLLRVELGPSAEIEALVDGWRAAIGKPVDGRGGPLAGESRPVAEALADELGERLRARVLDPLLAETGGADTLLVCLDDVLHLVPLDALPAGTGLVGDRLGIQVEVSTARLLAPKDDTASGPALLGLGGIDYRAETSMAPGESAASLSPPLAGDLREGGPREEFRPLPHTQAELERIGALFRDAHGVAPRLLTGGQASKRALRDLAPGTRFVHVATHGWFAPESLSSSVDALASDAGWTRLGLEEIVRGFAPMTLCGLALAGASRGRDSLGRVPGILTAEELCGIDLSACQLAVLSACETNVGLRRAGQGIQSLQAALHAAGARTAITSLWKVDDERTRRLMEDFYTNLWVEELGPAEALWKAKVALRVEGAPLRDWAGWVLTGAR